MLESNKRRPKKRQRNMNEWKQVTLKQLKNSGLEYITKRGKVVPAKSILPHCTNKCPLSCSTKVSSEKRNIIFKSYWELRTHKKRDFLASCVKQIQPTTRRVTVTVNKTCKEPRKFNSNFYFIIHEKDVRVCRNFFWIHWLLVKKTLRNVIDSISIDALSVSSTDKRENISSNIVPKFYEQFYNGLF